MLWIRVIVDSYFYILKWQSDKIFELGSFHKSTTPRPLINTLKYFRILFRIRGVKFFSLDSQKKMYVIYLYNVW
jgi:hypothetical protein